MEKVEKDILTEFITKVTKGGAMVNNMSLPEEIQSKGPSNSPNPMGGTKVISLEEILNHWSECVRQLEEFDENKSRAREGRNS